MCNNLVYLTTNDINKATPITDSKIIASTFEKRHGDVLRAIENIITKDESEYFTERKIASSEYIDGSGKKNRVYQLTEPQTMILIMGFTGKKAGKVKDAFVKQFMFMRHELTVRSETRSIGKTIRHSMTDSIRDNLKNDTNHKKYAYSNYSKLVYKKVLGSTVKKHKDRLGLKTSDNVRDSLSIDQLNLVQELESKIAAWIEGFTHVMNDKESYAQVKELVDNYTFKGDV